jgi:sortase A
VSAPVNTEVSRTKRDRSLRGFEKVTLFAGLFSLAIYGVALLDSQIQSRVAMWAFESVDAKQQLPGEGGAMNASAPISSAQTTQSSLVKASLLKTVAMPSATLRVLRLGIAAPVFEGTDALTLNHGLGRIGGTARFGEGGNIGIAGHRDSFFRPLKDVATGDSIEVESRTSRDVYVVDRVEIVDPSDVAVLQPRAGDGITLVTCYPFYFAGAAPRRFIVQASLRQRGIQPARQHAISAELQQVQKEK